MSGFNEQGFEKKLLSLKDSQDSISSLSDWCLQNKQHHKKIVTTWLGVLKKVRVENRLTLFYLANDVIQYSKRKNYDFVESWATALQKATTMVRHDKVMDRIMRIFKIWGDRSVYSEEFLTDLRGLLTAKKATPATPQPKQAETQQTTSTSSSEFNPSNLFTQMYKCKDLEDDTDLKLRKVNDCKHVNLNDLDAFRAMMKDRKHADGVAGQLDEAIQQVEHYKKALEVEIVERRAVIDLLQGAVKFYEVEKNDAKVVFNAYRNFGSRIKSLKRKLDEMIPTLSSPLPSPDVNAPSPSPDSDLDLPNDDDVSGIVECLERVVDSESDDDLMSIISYHSSDEENPKYSYFELLSMPDHLRRRHLPLPDPSFSDSDLTELDDSVDDMEESGHCISEDTVKYPLLHTQTRSKTLAHIKTLNQTNFSPLKPPNIKCIGEKLTRTKLIGAYSPASNYSPSLTVSSSTIQFKEPAQKAAPMFSDKRLESVADANCPLINDTISTCSLDSTNSVVSQPVPSSPKSDQPETSNIDNSSSNCTILDLSGDFLPTDDELTGLLECLADDLTEDPPSPRNCSSPLTNSKTG